MALQGDTLLVDAHKHLLRIQARIADDAIAEQNAINEKIAGNAKLAGIGLKIIDAALEHQREQNPYCEVILRHIARAVDAACQDLGFNLQKGVVRGVMPIRGVEAYSSDFYGTGIAIVGIDASVVPFTGMLTDLFGETLRFEETADGLAIVADPAECVERITEGKNLLENSDQVLRGKDAIINNWERFLLHFAGLSMPWKRPTLTAAQEKVKFQISSAMEVFVVGHEYGHHIQGHNAGMSAASTIPAEDSHKNEMEADRIAWRISKHLGALGFAGEATQTRNLWMESSAGAVAYLVAAEMVRRVREILETGRLTEPTSATHPSIRERLAALENWDGFDPELGSDFRRRRWLVCNLMERIFAYLSPKFHAAHETGLRPTHL
jgi:hypothetical protein